MTTVRALVPLKALTSAKSRLADIMPPEQRRDLVLHMATHVVDVLRQTVDEIVMLTTEPVSAFADLPRLADTAAELNDNLMAAVRSLTHARGDVLLVIFPDLPLLGAADVQALVAAAAGGIALAPDHNRTGTNALALRDPLRFRFQFGANSRALHEAEAARHGLSVLLLERDGLAYDVDDSSMLHICPAEFHACQLAGPD